jgi:hypothetical protein
MFTNTLLVLASLGGGFTPIKPVAHTVQRPSLEQEIGDLSGYYMCKGTEVGGKTYSGVVTVMKKNDLYLVQWSVGIGSNFTGVGIRQGNSLSCSWALPSEKGLIRGINVYRIEQGPRLIGRWASLPGPSVLQNETLTFLRPLEDEE